MLHLNFKTFKGTTLIEILVAIAIIILFSAAVVVNTRQESGLDEASRQLASDLRRAQNMAMAVEEQEGGNVPCGYGIYFDSANPNDYILFADVDASCNQSYNEGEDLIIGGSPISFRGEISISNDSFNIFFSSVSGDVVIAFDPFSIEIKDADNLAKNININSMGKIEVK